jgi:hypothetical protein
MKYMKDNYDFSQGKRGAIVPIASNQIKVNIVLEKEVVDWFRAKIHQQGGGDYDNLINEVLREYIKQEGTIIYQNMARENPVEWRRGCTVRLNFH